MKYPVIISITALAVSAGCEMPVQQTRAPETRTITYQLPVITPVEPAKQDQEKDGIRLSVAPYSYATKQTIHREIELIPTLLVVNNQRPAVMREIPNFEVQPRELRFKVKINNRLERVLRLAGTVVSFQVAGKTVAVDKARYEEFLNGIILPRQEGEYDIAGPDLSAVPDNSTIALFLYDIVTATDQAGNPTQRSNFEFFYTFSRQSKTQEAPIVARRIYLDESGQVVRKRRN
jgi:hypothetical protein